MNFSSLPPCTRRRIALGLVFLSGPLVAESSAALRRSATARNLLHGYTTQPLATDAPRPAERAFLQKALDASRLQLRMAELGSSQATSSEVRSHAEQLKADNRQLVDALTAIMQRKGVGTTANPAAPQPPPESYTQLAAKSGASFDREFVRVMAEVHEETITLFEQAAAESKDTDVRDLAAAQLPMLRAHRNRIVELKKTFD